uniref:OBP47-like domain-containing protein n=1 Tax=Anopheles minimus TaxID=112268 RepID=A0A182WHR5_9DIPT
MGMTKCCMVIFVLVGCTTSFISADPDCENLKDRRDEMDQCCQVEKIISLKDADDCSSAADEASEPHEKMMCTVQCKLQSLGVVNGEDIVQEKMLEYVERLEDGWKDTAKDIVTKCVEFIASMKTKMQEHSHNMKCSPMSGFFLMCLMKNTFEQCPADKWQNTSFCNKIKNGECAPKRD